MKQRRSTNPLATMGCLGLMAVGLFGAGVKLMSDKPVIRLRPELEKLYGMHGFRCSLHIQEGRLDIEPPAALMLDRFGKRRLGGEAFRRYLRLTKNQTQVVNIEVFPAPAEVVTREQAARFVQLEDFSGEIATQAAQAGGPLVAPPLLAPALGGVAVILDVTCDDAAARRVVAAVQRFADVSYVGIRRDGKTILEAGADAKLLGVGAAIAPVGTR